MIKSITVKNFRSVEEQTVELAPITLLYGNNAAGKSSLFYALNVLRNIVNNPQQPLDAAFNLGFAALGGFERVVFRHVETSDILISVSGAVRGTDFTYGVKLNPKHGEFILELGQPYSLNFSLAVPFPYPLNLNVERSVTLDSVEYKINWNGITAQVTPTPANEVANQKANEVTLLINGITEVVRGIDVVSVRRGFFKTQYGQVPVNPYPWTEDEVAALLAADENLDTHVSAYLEQTVGRQVRAKAKIGTSVADLKTIEPKTKVTTDVVNDGFGINQLVYVFAKILNRTTRTVCVEEPEANLHPSVIRHLPKSFIELVKTDKRQLIISTHSEAFVISMLAAIAKGEIQINEAAFYLTTRTDGVTKFTREENSEDGRVSEGLKSFMAGELDEVQAFFKPPKKARKSKSSSDVQETPTEVDTPDLSDQSSSPDADAKLE